MTRQSRKKPPEASDGQLSIVLLNLLARVGREVRTDVGVLANDIVSEFGESSSMGKLAEEARRAVGHLVVGLETSVNHAKQMKSLAETSSASAPPPSKK